MFSFKSSIVILIAMAIKIIYASAYAQPNARNSTTKMFKYIISDGVQDFAVEN